MIIETIELRNQIADEGHWLYQDQAEGFRYFTKKVYLGKNEEPWAECTEQEHQEHLAHNAHVQEEELKKLNEEELNILENEPNF